MADIDVATVISETSPADFYREIVVGEAAYWQRVLCTRQPYTDLDVRASYYNDIHALLEWFERLTGEKHVFKPAPADPDAMTHVAAELARAKYRIEGLETDLAQAREWHEDMNDRWLQGQQKIEVQETNLKQMREWMKRAEVRLDTSHRQKADLNEELNLALVNNARLEADLAQAREWREHAEGGLDTLLKQRTELEHALSDARDKNTTLQETLDGANSELRYLAKQFCVARETITKLERRRLKDMGRIVILEESRRQSEKGFNHDPRLIDSLNERLSQAQNTITILRGHIPWEAPHE